MYVNEFDAKIDAILNVHSSWITCVLVMIVKLHQKTKHAKWEMYEFQKYALHESIVILLCFEATGSVWVQTLAKYTFVKLENTTKGSSLVSWIIVYYWYYKYNKILLKLLLNYYSLVAPSFSSSYVISSGVFSHRYYQEVE